MLVLDAKLTDWTASETRIKLLIDKEKLRDLVDRVSCDHDVDAYFG